MLQRLPGAIALRQWRQQWVNQWLDRRIPPEAARATLHRRRLFILPTRLGYTFALTLALLLVGSLNYGTSMGFVVTFLLAGAGTLGMLHTYRNIEGIDITFAPAPAVFAGEVARFPVTLDPTDRDRWALMLDAAGYETAAIHVPAGGPRLAEVLISSRHRGRLQPGRVRLATRWPLGLFRAWSWVHPQVEVIVYPAPRDHGQPWPESGEGDLHAVRQTGADEFSELREYRPGDPPRHIAWKLLARTDELHTKHFDTAPTGERWLQWSGLDALTPEARLEQLCYWVVQLAHTGQRFGLELGGQRFGPDTGSSHRHRCLEALALFGNPGDSAT